MQHNNKNLRKIFFHIGLSSYTCTLQHPHYTQVSTQMLQENTWYSYWSHIKHLKTIMLEILVSKYNIGP